jgi:hypothetical protein
VGAEEVLYGVVKEGMGKRRKEVYERKEVYVCVYVYVSVVCLFKEKK